MGTEQFWQERKKQLQRNADTIHPDIIQTMEDNRALLPSRHPKALYGDCLQGALYWDQLSRSGDLSLNEMATMICRDVGCELQYCQATISDQYERPFDSCTQQLRQLNGCIAQEEKRYTENPEGRTMQEQVRYMLDKKKKEKYFHFLESQKIETPKEREYIIKEQNIPVQMSNKL